MYGKIIVPLDGSTLAEQAAAHAAELSRYCKAELVIVRVCRNREVMAQAVEYLDAVNRLAHFEGLAARCEARIGEPAAEIVKAAKECDADLIIICSHGRTGLARNVFGSVAEQVVRAAHCPVMVVKAASPDDPALKAKSA